MSCVALLAIAAAATGPARAQSNSEQLFYTLDGTLTGGSNTYYQPSEITQGGITWQVTGNTTMNPWRIGGKNLNAVDRDVYCEGSLDETITKVNLDFGDAANITVNSVTMIVASDAAFNNVIESKSVNFSTNSNVDVTPGTGIEWTDAYYKFVFNVSVGSSNKFVQLKSIKFYYDPNTSSSATPEPEPATAQQHKLDSIPADWTVKVAGVTQTLQTYDGGNPKMRWLEINETESVKLIPPDSVKNRVKSVCIVKIDDFKSMPLTMEALTAGTIVVNSPKSGMQYTLNGGAKTAMNATTTIDVAAGDKVAFYGNGTSITSYYNTKIAGGTAQVKVYGNIMSLVDEENFATATTLSDNAFQSLFDGNATLTDASELLLPATTLANNCYQYMFYGCSALTTAPKLPATTLTGNCYYRMFFNCSNLSSVTCLATDITATSCLSNWLHGVSATGTFTAATETEWPTGANGIPEGWTRVNH